MSIRHRYDDPERAGEEFSKKAVEQFTAERFKSVTINREYEVPYTAGYSKDGKTIYIDRHVPDTISYRGKKCDIIKPLVMHETTEISLESKPYFDSYELSHETATMAEFALVRAMGFDVVEYNKQVNEIVKRVYSRAKYESIPPDLDLEPYYDEKDYKCLKRMGITDEESNKSEE